MVASLVGAFESSASDELPMSMPIAWYSQLLLVVDELSYDSHRMVQRLCPAEHSKHKLYNKFAFEIRLRTLNGSAIVLVESVKGQRAQA